MSIHLRNISVRYQQWGQNLSAIDALSLDVTNGQWLLLTGHNGSGKSTLLKVIAGHETPFSGQVEMCLTESNKPRSNFHSDMYFVRQDPLSGTAENLSLEENLTVAMTAIEYRQRSSAERRRLIAESLAFLALSDRSRQLMINFSGGERQLVSLLIARLRRPRLLLLDEPFSALDRAREVSALALVRQIHEAGTTIIQITHDQSLIAQLGLRTLVLEKGRIVRDTSPSPEPDGESTRV